MPAYRKASIRELASAARELDSGVVEGKLHRDAGDGRWMVDSAQLNEWLARYDGQKIVLIVASLQDNRPVLPRTCRTCGREYVGIECPHCREARIRLRGY